MIILPYGHDQKVYGRPWITWSLIAVNVVAFAITFFLDRQANARIDAATHELVVECVRYPEARVRSEVFATLPTYYRADLLDIVSDDPDDAEEPGALEVKVKAKKLAQAISSAPLIRFGYQAGKPSLQSALSALFMHADVMHLAGNMLFLWLVGVLIECFWESRAFLLLYFASGFAATLAHHLAAPQSFTPLVGASGAIAGIMGAFVVSRPTAKIRIFYATLWGLVGVRAVPAWFVLPGWLALQLGFALFGAGEGVAYWAHVGGFTAGVIGGLVMRWGGWIVEDAAHVLPRARRG